MHALEQTRIVVTKFLEVGKTLYYGNIKKGIPTNGWLVQPRSMLTPADAGRGAAAAPSAARADAADTAAASCSTPQAQLEDFGRPCAVAVHPTKYVGMHADLCMLPGRALKAAAVACHATSR